MDIGTKQKPIVETAISTRLRYVTDEINLQLGKVSFGHNRCRRRHLHIYKYSRTPVRRSLDVCRLISDVGLEVIDEKKYYNIASEITVGRLYYISVSK